MAPCTTRFLTVGMPKGRNCPGFPGFGMSLRLAGLGRYAPERSARPRSSRAWTAVRLAFHSMASCTARSCARSHRAPKSVAKTIWLGKRHLWHCPPFPVKGSTWLFIPNLVRQSTVPVSSRRSVGRATRPQDDIIRENSFSTFRVPVPAVRFRRLSYPTATLMPVAPKTG